MRSYWITEIVIWNKNIQHSSNIKKTHNMKEHEFNHDVFLYFIYISQIIKTNPT